MENDFINWEFIYDTPHKITYNYGKVSPASPVNYRINYIPHVIESDVVVTFGKGEFVKYGESIFNTLPVCEKHILYNVDNLPSYLKGAKRIITVWSQTAREAIALGKIPEVYSANTVDDKICKKLDKKGVLTWKGNMFQEINIY